MVRKKQRPAFINAHCAKYGLNIATRNTNGEVDAVSCRFCFSFGREECNNEETPSRKRKKTSHMKYFSSFRADNYKTHLESQHRTKWEEYQLINLDKENIEEFFKSNVPFVNTLDAHLDIEKPHSFVIDEKIVDCILGDMLYDPQDDDETKQQALSMFKKDSNANTYVVEIKNFRRFRLCIKFISCGTSIRLCSRLLYVVKEETKHSY